MKLPATLRTLGVSLALLAGASMAIAGGGLSLDEHPRAPAPATRANPPAVATPASASDDAPRLSHAAVRGTFGPARTTQPPALRADGVPVTQRTPQAPAGDHRTDKQERGRPAPSTVVHAHRPGAQRAKGAMRSSPATPGMGLLLRMGTGAGRELSLLLDDVPYAPSTMRAGRAPPRAGPHSTLARDPIACAAAPAPRFVTPQPVPPGVTPPTSSVACAFQSADPPRECTCARATCLTAPRSQPSPALPMERIPCSRAARLKGAAACIVLPFGGFST
jgi:hypothetical protein